MLTAQGKAGSQERLVELRYSLKPEGILYLNDFSNNAKRMRKLRESMEIAMLVVCVVLKEAAE